MIRLFVVYILIFGIGCTTAPQLVSKDPQVAGRNFTGVTNTILARKLTKENPKPCPATAKEIEKKIWRDLLEYGAACSAKGKWPSVEFIGQALADRFPTAPWGFFFLSLSAHAVGDTTRAFWMLEQASDKDKSMALFPYERGRIFLTNGEVESAVSEFEKALKLDNSLYEADLYLGQIRLRNGDMKAAENSFKNVLKYEPFKREALIGAARCLASNGDAKLAVDYLDRVVSTNKKDTEARYERAVILDTMLQQPEEALREYRALLELNDNKSYLQKRINDLEKLISTKRLAKSQVGGKR